MILKILLSLMAILPFSTSLNAGPSDNLNQKMSSKPQGVFPKIKVLIAHDQDKLLLEITDKYKIIDPFLKKSESLRFKGKSQYIEAMQGGLKWGEGFPGVHQLGFIPGSPETKILVNSIPYNGIMYVYDNAIGRSVSAVNEVFIEDYLASILSQNNSQPLAEETLAALLIAARTNAYNQVQNPKSKFWDVDAAQVGYKGNGDVSMALQNALKKTRYMVLSLNGKLDENIKTFPAQWEPIPKDLAKTLHPKPELSKITIAEANELARKGEHAATILEKAFPKTSIQLIHLEDK